MPWFLFMAGTSISLSLAKYTMHGVSQSAFSDAVHRVLMRVLKLFALGVLLQGGGWFDTYTFGYNYSTLRWCGILQRIAFGYGCAALIELYVPTVSCTAQSVLPTDREVISLARVTDGDTRRFDWGSAKRRLQAHSELFSAHSWRWLLVLLLTGIQAIITYTVYVPSWSSSYGWDPDLGKATMLATPFEVKCDVRGHVSTPECTAASLIDRAVFGQDRLGVWMSARLPQCSPCSPGNPSKTFRPDCYADANATAVDAPNWCFAHMYDPEGLLATFGAAFSVWLGVHVGRVLHATSIPKPHELLAHWAIFNGAAIGLGLGMHFGGIPMNKQLWSPSYALFMAGSCGLSLAAAYVAVDVEYTSPTIARVAMRFRRLLFPLEAAGMNAILIFFWHGTAECIINALYVDPPLPGDQESWPKAQGALLGSDGWIRAYALSWIGTKEDAQMAMVLLKIAGFLGAACLCHKRGYFWKI